MSDYIDLSTKWFNNYCDSFSELSEKQQLNFKIKKDHSMRVAENAIAFSTKLDWAEEEQKLAYFIGLYHDIGRFSQMAEFDTFSDEKSVDHAEKAIDILNNNGLLEKLGINNKELVFTAIINHNKFKISDGLNGNELLHAKLIRDADKIDILKVLTDYYSKRNEKANHSLTWELPVGTTITPAAAKEVLSGKMVTKKNVHSEIDVKIMQLSWVYDLNFRPAFESLVKNRYLEKIYNSLPKNDLVIEIYRKIKVYTENRIME